MRTLLTAAALAVVALAGVAACSGNADPSATAPAQTTVADETATVCAQAISEGTAAGAEFRAKLNEGVQAVLAGDQEKANQIETELHERVDAWAAKLTELSDRSIDPAVKTALTEAAGTLTSLNSEQDETPVDQVEAKFAEFATKLAAACA
jgi:hypothetical protein